MLMLDSFLKKSSFCANGEFSDFKIAFRSGGFPQLGELEILLGGVFIDIVINRGHTPLFSINSAF